MKTVCRIAVIFLVSLTILVRSDPQLCETGTTEGETVIRLSKDSTQFVLGESGNRFIVWGLNYDHDNKNRLLEDYWYREWSTVEEDFEEMKTLGANLVRIHLQLERFMLSADSVNQQALNRLTHLIELAEHIDLYLDITGLGCYKKEDVPVWYDTLDEAARWDVQARFWEAIAQTCVGTTAVFCYDLMNEPILPGENEKEKQWLTSGFDHRHYVQRITLDLEDRTREQVACTWVNRMVTAIRKYDNRHMITVGVIPWVYTFPETTPLFYSKEISKNLDFVSVHFYPEKGKVDKALSVLAAYDIDKPLVIEETSPLYCGIDEFDLFINNSRETVDGYIGFYWGKTINKYLQENDGIKAGIMAEWLEYFRTKGVEILVPRSPNTQKF